MVDRAFKLNVGRQGFGSVNPEIRIIEGRIIEVLLNIERLKNLYIYIYIYIYTWRGGYLRGDSVVNHGDFRDLRPSVRPSLKTHFSTLRVLFVFQRIGCFLQTSSSVLLNGVFK